MFNHVLTEEQVNSLMELNDPDTPVRNLTWDGAGDGQWGATEGGFSRWQEGLTQVDWYPDTDTPARASVSSDTVTVAENRSALSLSVDDGATITVADDRTLPVAGETNFAPGTKLNLGQNAELSVFRGGTLDTVAMAAVSLTGGASL